MKILMLGDVTSPAAADYLAGALPEARRRLGADFVTVNAENAGSIKVVVEEQTDYQAYRDKIRTTITINKPITRAPPRKPNFSQTVA